MHTISVLWTRTLRLREVPCSTCGKAGVGRDTFCAQGGAPTRFAMLHLTGDPTHPQRWPLGKSG